MEFITVEQCGSQLGELLDKIICLEGINMHSEISEDRDSMIIWNDIMPCRWPVYRQPVLAQPGHTQTEDDDDDNERKGLLVHWKNTVRE